MCGQRCKGLAARLGLERTSYKTNWLRRTVANPAKAFGTVARSASILLSLRGCVVSMMVPSGLRKHAGDIFVWLVSKFNLPDLAKAGAFINGAEKDKKIILVNCKLTHATPLLVDRGARGGGQATG